MSQKAIFKICGLIMGVSGLTILFSTLFPIFSYEWQAAVKYPILISPLVEEENSEFTLESDESTKLSNWFDDKNQTDLVSQNVKFYTISIPKLKIDSATVKIGGNDLSGNLIQYPGTALPGKLGNSVIFGHSVLPQFFNPENYLSIFSTLFMLKKGDDVYADYDGVSYKFRVENIFEVKNSDIEILEQSSNSSYLTLVTCSPPGDPRKKKRLIVRARLVPPELDTSRLSFNSNENTRN